MAHATEDKSKSELKCDQVRIKVKAEPRTDPDDQLRNLLERPVDKQPTTSAPPPPPPPRLLQPPPPTSCPPGGQRTINSYFGPQKPVVVSEKPNNEETKAAVIDQESIRGLFGWTTLEGVHIPFILRQEEKFTAVRIIERTLLKKYLQALPTDVYSCTYIKSYFITENEAKLLNEINLKHCERQFGHEPFSSNDLVVHLSDVEQLYEFLSTCYYKLTRPQLSGGSKEDRCGIIRVDGSTVPYVRRNGTKFVPLSLFERDSGKALEEKAETLEPWEASYLKFCCKMAGIEHDFLKDPCAAVPIGDVFRTAGEEWWPPSLQSVKCWPTNNASGLKVHKDSNGFKPYLLGQAMSSDLCYNKSSLSQLHNLYSVGRESTASLWPVGSLTHALASSKSPNGCQLTEDRLSAHTGISATYPIPGLTQPPLRPSPGMPPPNPQPFIYNGQWWGSLDSNPLGAPGVPHIQSLAAHCPQGPTQSSPNATHLPHDSLLFQPPLRSNSNGHHQHSSQGVASMVTISKSNSLASSGEGTSYRSSSNEKHTPAVRVTEKVLNLVPSRNSALPLQHKSSADVGSKHSRTSSSSVSHPQGRHHSVPSIKAHTSVTNGDKNGLPRITSVMSLAVAPNCNPSSNMNGLHRSSPLHPEDRHSVASVRESGSSFLAKHLLSSNNSASETLLHGRRPENHVVAPGNVQSLAGKMSSPKPGNQVPATVAGDHHHSSHRLPSVLDSLGRTTVGQPPPAHLVGSLAATNGTLTPLSFHSAHQAFSSKLQELLCQSDLATYKTLASSLVPGRSPRYRVQTVTVTGTTFYAVNSIEYEHKTALMVPLAELTANVKPRMPSQIFKNILINVFGVRLFDSNRFQEEVLRSHVDLSQGGCSSTLICVEDLVKYLPQLLYTISRLRPQEEGRDGGQQPVTKRSRTEGVVNG